jgi:hypothetical protein
MNRHITISDRGTRSGFTENTLTFWKRDSKVAYNRYAGWLNARKAMK